MQKAFLLPIHLSDAQDYDRTEDKTSTFESGIVALMQRLMEESLSSEFTLKNVFKAVHVLKHSLTASQAISDENLNIELETINWVFELDIS